MSSSFRPQRYLKPASTQEVLAILSEHGAKARIIGGGTTIHELAFRGLLTDVQVLVDLERLNLNYVMEEQERIRIGASVTFSDLTRQPSIQPPAYRAITDALRAIRPLQVKNVATMAGCLCGAIPYYDMPTALMAVGATLVIQGVSGTRTVSLDEFYQGYFLTALQPGEFVAEVQLPRLPKGAGSAFQKFSVTADDWAIINVGTGLQITPNQVCKDAAVAVGGGVEGALKRVSPAETRLQGHKLESASIRDAAEAAAISVPVSEDIRASRTYRRHLVKVLVEKTLVEAAKRAGMQL